MQADVRSAPNTRRPLPLFTQRQFSRHAGLLSGTQAPVDDRDPFIFQEPCVKRPPSPSLPHRPVAQARSRKAAHGPLAHG